MTNKEAIWQSGGSIDPVGAAYPSSAQLEIPAPEAGELTRFSVKRRGANSGLVTVKITVDEAGDDILVEAAATLNGAGATDAWGGYEPTFVSNGGVLYVWGMDAAAAADVIEFKASGRVGERMRR